MIRILFTLVLSGFVISCASGQVKEREIPEKTFTEKELALYDGKAYVAIDGVVYDVTDIDAWKGGKHKLGIVAGKDVSDKIDRSPHGRKVLNKLPVVGRYIEREETDSEAVYTTTGNQEKTSVENPEAEPETEEKTEDDSEEKKTEISEQDVSDEVENEEQPADSEQSEEENEVEKEAPESS